MLPLPKTKGPLDGIRVLDLTNVLSGPFCCHQLAHLGAEVIKVERPGSGDLARELGADPSLNARLMGVSFLAQNAGKKSLTLNFKVEAGREILRKLAATADVLVENFRPGVMDRLGVGYQHLKDINPKLIYCAITGFGQEGMLRDAPAYDQIIQGMSGGMSITGHENCAPLRVGYPVADTAGGLTAAMAIAACLASRESVGRYIDVAMLDSMMTTMGWAISNYLNAGVEPSPQGNENITASPSGTFQTATRPINIAANKQEQFEALCRVLDRQEWAEDPRFNRRQARLANRMVLNGLIEGVLQTLPADHWRDLLVNSDVPCGEVLSVAESLSLPHLSDRNIIAEFHDVAEVDKPVRVLRTGFKIDGEALEVSVPPPNLGQHTDAILEGLGYCSETIAELRRENVL